MSYIIAHEGGLVLSETLESARIEAGTWHQTQLYKLGHYTPIAVYELRLVEVINPVLLEKPIPPGGTFA